MPLKLPSFFVKPVFIVTLLCVGIFLGAYASQYYIWTIRYSIDPFTEDITLNLPETFGATPGEVTFGRTPHECEVDENSIAVWHMNEGKDCTIFDATTNHYDGSLKPDCSDDCPTWTTGMYGSALQFDGKNDYVSMGTPSAFYFGTGESFTAECWIKTTQTAIVDRVEILGIYSGPTYPTPNQFWAVFLEASGKASFWLRVNNGAATTYILSTTLVNDGSWHHIAAVKDVTASLMRIYIDGVEEASSSFTDGETSNGYEFHIGNGCWDRYFMGIVDELCISNVARTESEIKAHSGYYPAKLIVLPGTTLEVHFTVAEETATALLSSYFDLNVTIDVYQSIDRSFVDSAKLVIVYHDSIKALEVVHDDSVTLTEGTYYVIITVSYWTGAIETATPPEASFTINVYAIEAGV